MLPLEPFVMDESEVGQFVIMTTGGVLTYYDMPYWGA
jgi:hypothetical protein